LKAALKLKVLIPTEDDEAQCLMQWALTQRWQHFHLSRLLIMIPNGAYLGGDSRQRAITMCKLKRTGFRNGVFDYLLPIPRPPYPGLFLELKRRRGWVVSEEQVAFKLDMDALGWATVICKGWEEAKAAITHYLHGAPQ